MGGKHHKFNIAFCIGDIQGVCRFMRGFLDAVDGSQAANVHIFNSFVKDYDDSLASVGGINIYNLPNYDKMDMLVVVPEFLSNNDDILDSVIKRARAAGKPVLCVGREHDDCYRLLVDYDDRIEDICDHFIEKHGFDTIGFLAGVKGLDISERRTESYKRSLIKHGIEVDERRIIYGEFWETPTLKAVEQMINSDLPLPQALVCANDAMALAAIKKFNEYGINVPEQICVSGLDGIDEARFYVTTSTMLGYETGKKAAEYAVGICNGEELPEELLIQSKIEYGISCGCIKPDIGGSIDRRHTIFTNFYNSSTYTLMALRLSQNVNSSLSFEDMSNNLAEAMKKFWSCDIWVSICSDYITGFVNSDDINKTGADSVLNSKEIIHIKDYSDEMNCVVNIQNKEVKAPIVFRTSELLPDFYNVSDRVKSILYAPLQFNKKTIGYFAFGYYPWSENDYILNIVTSYMSYAIENVRRQSDLLAYARMIDELYITDPLTTLYNRRGFFRLYRGYCESEDKWDSMVISVDLDNLKAINDTYGHSEGDNAIKTVADALKSSSKDGDICARFGGDEYVVFGRCQSESEATLFIADVKKYLDAYNRSSDKPYEVTASCGASFMPRDTDKHIDYFINIADEKMYVNKETHKRTREIT